MVSHWYHNGIVNLTTVSQIFLRILQQFRSLLLWKLTFDPFSKKECTRIANFAAFSLTPSLKMDPSPILKEEVDPTREFCSIFAHSSFENGSITHFERRSAPESRFWQHFRSHLLWKWIHHPFWKKKCTRIANFAALPFSQAAGRFSTSSKASYLN